MGWWGNLKHRGLLLHPPTALSTSTIVLLPRAAHSQGILPDMDLPANTSLLHPLPVSLYQKGKYCATH